MYRMVGNFCKDFNLANWQVSYEIAEFNFAKIFYLMIFTCSRHDLDIIMWVLEVCHVGIRYYRSQAQHLHAPAQSRDWKIRH